MTFTHLRAMKFFSASLAALTMVMSGAALAPNALAGIDINMRGKGSITYINDGNPVSRTRSFTGGVMYESKPHPNYANPLKEVPENSGKQWTNDNAFVNKAAKDRFKYPGVPYHNSVPLGTLHPEGADELQRQVQQHYARGTAENTARRARNARKSSSTPQPQIQQSRPVPHPKRSASSRSTSSPAPRFTSRPTNALSSRCPAGTSYHKIKLGGLLFKRTVAEGCYTDFQASQLRMQANSNQRQRQRDFQRDIQEATRGPVNCSGTVNSWGNGYGTYNTTCY